MKEKMELNKEDSSRIKKITHLIPDCMEIIVGYLSFIDLVNFADSSKQFYSIARDVFKRKYQNMNIIFDEA